MSTTESEISTTTNEQKKTFDILFIGLVLFLKRARVALMPDGRNPDDPKVAPHIPYLVVDPEAVTDRNGWETNDQQQIEFMRSGVYRLPKCQLKITAATEPGDLDADHNDRFAPKLNESNPDVRVDESGANAIVRCPIGNGTLAAFRRPSANDEDDNVAIISRLRVKHSEAITVEVEDLENNTTRTLLLAPGTDIALANIAYPPDDKKKGDDFSIFGRLTTDGKIGPTPATRAPRLPPLPRDHQIFKLGLPINDGTVKCGVRTCCPPPE